MGVSFMKHTQYTALTSRCDTIFLPLAGKRQFVGNQLFSATRLLICRIEIVDRRYQPVSVMHEEADSLVAA